MELAQIAELEYLASDANAKFMHAAGTGALLELDERLQWILIKLLGQRGAHGLISNGI